MAANVMANTHRDMWFDQMRVRTIHFLDGAGTGDDRAYSRNHVAVLRRARVSSAQQFRRPALSRFRS